MAESSILWTNNATGDGTSGGYAQAKSIEWMRALFTKNANLGGVSPEYLNELAVSGTSSPVAVATGAAVVYGFVYFNDSSTTVAVPSPVTSTRIDRIVLRASWAAQTVRLTRIAGTEGGSAPALVQTPLTTWDIPLATVSITTGGVITVTDAREWLDVTGDAAITAAKLASDAVTTAKILDANVTTAKIADANVTTAKIANDAVDDTKVGNRVPALTHRQGGSASNWALSGTTTRTPTTVRMQCGVIAATLASGEATGTVTFPVAFSDLPLVYVTPNAGLTVAALSSGATASNFSFKVFEVGGTSSTSVTLSWLAIGPE